MEARIFHNPRCSKSRQALQLLKEHKIEPQIIEYLKTPPTADDICDLCKKMGIPPRELIRFKEAIAKELGISRKDDREDGEWCRLMAEHPKLIERPIFIYGDKVVLGRPPEKVIEIVG